MFLNIPRMTATIALLCVSCASPGYLVSVDTSPRGPIDLAWFQGLEQRARGLGFRIVWERREEIIGGRRWTSCYERRSLPGRRDGITICITFPQPQEEHDREIAVMIHTSHKGQDPAVKAEVDALGEVFRAELAQVLGSDHVSIEKGPYRACGFSAD